jgi:lipopolysaccharide export system protein LptA
MLIKKLFGNYSHFVKCTKFFLCITAIIIPLYISSIIFFGGNEGKIKLLQSNATNTTTPYLKLINGSIDGISFGKYRYKIITNESIKNHSGDYILSNIDALITSKDVNVNITCNTATYGEENQIGFIKDNVQIKYLDSISFNEEIIFDFPKDYFASHTKIITNSQDYDFEATNGFKSDRIDFSFIEFFGPVRLKFKTQQGTLEAQNMNLFFEDSNKNLIRAEFQGNVKFHNEKFHITSDKADYITKNKHFVFYDNLNITSDKTKLIGDIFIYDVQKKTGFVRTKSQNNKRIEMYFHEK